MLVLLTSERGHEYNQTIPSRNLANVALSHPSGTWSCIGQAVDLITRNQSTGICSLLCAHVNAIVVMVNDAKRKNPIQSLTTAICSRDICHTKPILLNLLFNPRLCSQRNAALYDQPYFCAAA